MQIDINHVIPLIYHRDKRCNLTVIKDFDFDGGNKYVLVK